MSFDILAHSGSVCLHEQTQSRSAAGEKKRGSSNRPTDSMDDSCLSGYSGCEGAESDYYASASDTDSGNSDEDRFSNPSDTWSPTLHINTANSDSGNTTMNEDRSHTDDCWKGSALNITATDNLSGSLLGQRDMDTSERYDDQQDGRRVVDGTYAYIDSQTPAVQLQSDQSQVRLLY